MTPLRTNPSFRWDLVAWSIPDCLPRHLCAYCHGGLDPDGVWLMLFRPDGSGAQFCDDCVELMAATINNNKKR